MPSNCNGVHVSYRFLKKTSNLPLKSGYFYSSVSSSTFKTTFWLPLFVSAEPIEIYYRLIDLNEDSKVIQGVK